MLFEVVVSCRGCCCCGIFSNGILLLDGACLNKPSRFRTVGLVGENPSNLFFASGKIIVFLIFAFGQGVVG